MNTFERLTTPDDQGHVAWTHLLVAIYADGSRHPWAFGKPLPGKPRSEPTPWGAWVHEPIRGGG